MFYTSTRDNKVKVDSLDAILSGISTDGGLFVPSSIPKIDHKVLNTLIKKHKKSSKYSLYKETAKIVFKTFFSELKNKDIEKIVEVYDVKNWDLTKSEKNDNSPVILNQFEENLFFLDLTKGKTSAFKDIALSALSTFINLAKGYKKSKLDTLIITATSGDTGKAALEGFKNKKGFKLFVLYPKNGVSVIQKKQMMSQEGKNLKVYGIKGNFDDAQKEVKDIFNDKDFIKNIEETGYKLTSANSINIARLIPQIVYYIYSYLLLAIKYDWDINKKKEKVNFAVPTGNFGNVLAAYISSLLFVPVNKLIICSNENNILTDFFNTGIYDTKRKFKITNSPSMDILVSSNLERYLHFVFKNDDKVDIKKLMYDLKEKKKFTILRNKLNVLNKNIYADYLNEKDTLKVLGETKILDTHSSVAYGVYKKYLKKTKDNTKTILTLTASLYKFPTSVLNAFNIKENKDDIFSSIEKIKKISKVHIPKNIKELKNKKDINKEIVEINKVKEKILRELKSKN